MSLKKPSHIFFVIFVSVFTLISAGVFFIRSFSLASDGSGSVTVSPTSTLAGSIGNAFALAFTAAESMPSGGLSITVPSGWSAPQGIAGTAGYTTVATTGMLAKVEDAANSLTGWANSNACKNGFALDSSFKHEGTAAIRCMTGTQDWGDYFYKSMASENWSGYTKVGFWIYSTKAISGSNFKFMYAAGSTPSSPLEYLPVTVPANTWTFVTLNFGATNRTTVGSYGFFIYHLTSLDNLTLYIDDVMLGPGTPSFSGNDVRLNFLQLTAGQTATVTYGAGGGTSGVAVPSTSGNAVFDLKTRTTDSGTLTSISSSPVVNVRPVATRFVILDPTDTTVDQSMNVTVQAQDASGNIDTNYQNDVTLAVSGSATGGGLVNITNGVGLLPISDRVAESVTLSVSDSQATGLNVTSTQTATFAPGAIARLALNDPGSMTAGNRIEYAVSRTDQYGNAVTSGTSTVYFYTNSTDASARFYNASSGGSQVTSTVIANGSSMALIWYADQQVGNWTITASDNALAPDDVSGIHDATDTIQIALAPATHFVIDNPTDGTVDAPIAVTVRALSASGDLDTNYQNDVTLVADGSVTGAGLVSIMNGVGTVSISDQMAETVHLSLLDTLNTGLTVASTEDVVFAPGVGRGFVLSGPTSVTAGQRAAFHLTRKDQYGNASITGATNVFLYASSPRSRHAFYDAPSGGSAITSLVIPSGTSTIELWYEDEAAGSWEVSASDNASAPDGVVGINDATAGIAVFPDIQAQLFLDGSDELIAGSRTAYTVTRQDRFGNAVTSTNTAIYLYTASTSTAAAFFETATGSSLITSILIPMGTSTVTLWYGDEKTGMRTVTVSDNPSAPDGATGLSDGVRGLTVNPSSTARFLLDHSGDMMAGTRLQYTVTRKDIFDNLTTVGSQIVRLFTTSITGAAAFFAMPSGDLPITFLTILAGQSSANFWYFDDVPGSWTITATDSTTTPDGAVGISDGSDSVNVTPIPIVATRFVIDDPTDGTVDAPIMITVKAEDEAGNIDTTYQSDVTLLASGSVTGEGLVDMSNGIGTVELNATLAQTSQLSLADTENTNLNVSSTQNVIFSPGAVSRFILSIDSITQEAGATVPCRITREDQYGNSVISGNTPVYLYTNSTGASADFYDALQEGSERRSVLIPAGTSTASLWYRDEKAGTWNLTASDNANAPDGRDGVEDAVLSLTFIPGATASFHLSDPGDMTVATRVPYRVTRKDAYGNAVSAGTQTVYLYTNSAGSGTAFYGASNGGSAIMSRIISDGEDGANFWYFDETPGSWMMTVSDHGGGADGAVGITDAVDSITVQNIPIIATHFVVLDPSDALIGGSVEIAIQAQDDMGNIDTSYEGSVTLLKTGSAIGGGIVHLTNGVGTSTITDANPETVSLSLSDSAGTGLDVSSVQSVVFSAVPPGPSGAKPFGGGGGEGISSSQLPRGLLLIGDAYPGGTVKVVIRGQRTELVVSERKVNSNGSFRIMVPGPFTGSQTIGTTVFDKDGNPTPTRYFSPYIKGDQLQEKKINVVPTIVVSDSRISKGNILSVSGFATLDGIVQLMVDDRIMKTVPVSADGSYVFLVSTDPLAVASHTVKVKQVSDDGLSGDFSLQQNFFVTGEQHLQFDLNDNGKVDIADWSIFLSKWKSSNEAERKQADMNDDGETNIKDFSIFVGKIHL